MYFLSFIHDTKCMYTNTEYSKQNEVEMSHFLECALLYSHVADFALVRTSLEGSKQCAGSVFASLIVSMLDSVPFGSKLGRKAVLFFRTIENTCSSCAFECGIIKTNLAIRESRGKRYVLSGAIILDMWCHTMSIL